MQGFLDLRRLRYFRTIAELGSMSAAARSLNLAQPALSHHIRALEQWLGTPLFQRRYDGVVLTTAGERLLRHAIDIDDRVGRAEADMRSLVGTKMHKVKVRLAVITSLATDLTPAIVGAMAREMPEVVLRITESGTQDGRDLLVKGRADFAICLSADPGEIPFAYEQLYLVEAGDSDEQTPVRFADVLLMPLVLPASRNPLRDLLDNEAARIGGSLNVVLEVDGPGSRKNAVQAGLGSTIFGAHYGLELSRSSGLSLRPIAEPAMVRPIYLGVRSGLEAGFVSQVRAVLKQALHSLGSIQPEAQQAPNHMPAE